MIILHRILNEKTASVLVAHGVDNSRDDVSFSWGVDWIRTLCIAFWTKRQLHVSCAIAQTAGAKVLCAQLRKPHGCYMDVMEIQRYSIESVTGISCYWHLEKTSVFAMTPLSGVFLSPCSRLAFAKRFTLASCTDVIYCAVTSAISSFGGESFNDCSSFFKCVILPQ